MFDKAVHTCPLVFDSAPDWYVAQEMCNELVSKELFMLKHCLDRYKTQEMRDKSASIKICSQLVCYE